MECASCFKFLCQKSDFGCGFLVFGCFRQLFNVLGLIFLFSLGFRVLQFGNHFKGLIHFLCGFRGKLSDLRNGFCSKNCLDGKCNTKVSPCGLLEFWENSEPNMIGQWTKTKEIGNGNVVSNGEFGDETNEREFYGEDEEIDGMELRNLVKIERKRANAACLDLERERIAAASAAEEAMAMVLRLQNEKSLIEMEAKQYRRLAEEKQIHDQEVIQSLKWIVMRHESDRSILEEQLTFCRRKLTLLTKGGDGGDESEDIDEPLRLFNLDVESSPGDVLISSLDMDLAP